MGRVEDALADFAEAIKHSPHDHLPLKHRAMLNEELERYNEALAMLHRAL